MITLSSRTSQWLRPPGAGAVHWLPLAWGSLPRLPRMLNKELPDSLVFCTVCWSEKCWETRIGYTSFHYSCWNHRQLLSLIKKLHMATNNFYVQV